MPDRDVTAVRGTRTTNTEGFAPFTPDTPSGGALFVTLPQWSLVTLQFETS